MIDSWDIWFTGAAGEQVESGGESFVRGGRNYPAALVPGWPAERPATAGARTAGEPDQREDQGQETPERNVCSNFHPISVYIPLIIMHVCKAFSNVHDLAEAALRQKR